MNEKNKLLLLSHCLLNQSVRAGGSYTPGATREILSLLSRFDISVYQLPCPEYIFVGQREKKTQDEWERIEGFKKFCSQLADNIQNRLKEITDNLDIVMVGISRSPCCSANKVYRGNKVVEGTGLWVEELKKRFKLDIVEFDYKQVEESVRRIEEFLLKTKSV